MNLYTVKWFYVFLSNTKKSYGKISGLVATVLDYDIAVCEVKLLRSLSD